VSGRQITLSWADNSTNEDGFKVYRSTDGVTWTWFASAGPNVTASSWESATPGTGYSFRVTAYNAAGESAASNTATATTPSAPAAPSGLAATAASGTQDNTPSTDDAGNDDADNGNRSTDGS